MTRHSTSAAAQRQAAKGRAATRRAGAGRGRLRRWTGGRLGGLKVALPALATSVIFLGIVWSLASGWGPRSVDEVRAATLDATGDAGFRIEEVLVAGRDQTDREAILTALGVTRGDPILGFDPHLAHERVMGLPWIRSASIERRLPGTILVRIEERVPMALWQHERQHKLIDREGNVLADHDLQNFTHLPMVVGREAHRNARSFLDVLGQYPEIADEVEAAIRVGERRWDLRLTSGVEVRLPETGLTPALNELSRMMHEVDLFDRDVVAIDLRLEDRLIVQTSPMATERRGLPEENT
ncbi:cell division protein FtsQ/DivIB [Fodinicurvata sp. EGI_FJ10296]|uniref:cell division protein FtsQ/DivIB n=1 Tax=Fodinicurvata sp. EGI_FJ10296 TaxID=3231908 RepID=UPI00345646D0